MGNWEYWALGGIVLILVSVMLLLIGMLFLEVWPVQRQNVYEEVYGVDIPLRHLKVMSDRELYEVYGIGEYQITVKEGEQNG